jgi:hypothetical protein
MEQLPSKILIPQAQGGVAGLSRAPLKMSGRCSLRDIMKQFHTDSSMEGHNSGQLCDVICLLLQDKPKPILNHYLSPSLIYGKELSLPQVL